MQASEIFLAEAVDLCQRCILSVLLQSVGGQPYSNDYCFFFELEDGKIKAIAEYTDQLTVKEAIGDAEFEQLQHSMAPVVEAIRS